MPVNQAIRLGVAVSVFCLTSMLVARQPEFSTSKSLLQINYIVVDDGTGSLVNLTDHLMRNVGSVN